MLNNQQTIEINNSGGKKSPFYWALAGGIGISAVFYLLQLLGMREWLGPIYFLKSRWYFVLPLIAGFSVQVGLFRAINLKVHQGKTLVVTSGGVSTGSMVACCAHNLASFVPILGLSGLAALLSQYQNYVFGVSLLFVFGGVLFMWRKYRQLQKHFNH